MGRKRIELFGNNKSIRKGWVTLGEKIMDTNFKRDVYESWFEGPES